MKIPPLRIFFSKRDRKQIMRAIDKCLSLGQVSQGKNTEIFEEKFARYIGCRYAVAVNSGSSAIEISMRILNATGKEVIIPTNTFFATATGVMLAGGMMRLVDIDEDTLSISIKTLEKSITKKTAGVIIVHVGGLVTSEINKIRTWCRKKNLWLLEDCAHAHGSEIFGKKAGNFGIAGAYSFFATKVMTSGEGGMIVTNNKDFADKARLLRNHGKKQPWVSLHTAVGSNWRMNEFSACVGINQLKNLDKFIKWRDKIASIYNKILLKEKNLKIILPKGKKNSWYKYIILLPDYIIRTEIKKRLLEKGIKLSGGVYEIPLHKQPVLKNFSKGSFPVADEVCFRHICLPVYYGMTQEEAKYVANNLLEAIKKK